MGLRESVAAILRRKADEIEADGESKDLGFAVFEHDEFNESVSNCLDTADDCESAESKFLEAVKAGRNVTLQFDVSFIDCVVGQ